MSLVYGDSVCQIDDYLAVDKNAATSSIITDGEIINAVQNATRNASDNDQDDDDENEEQPKVRLADAYSALRTLRIYGLQMQNHAVEDVTNQCENVLLGIGQNNLKQKKLTEYFKWMTHEIQCCCSFKINFDILNKCTMKLTVVSKLLFKYFH